MLTVDEAAEAALRYRRTHGFEPSVSLNTKSIEAVRRLVANNLGLAILSGMVYRPWSVEGKPVETIKTLQSVPSMNVGLAWRAGTVLSRAMQAIRHHVKQRYLERQSPNSAEHR